MKKIILALILVLTLFNFAFAYEIPKNEEYYKSQIQNLRLTYNIAGLFNAIAHHDAEVVELFMKAGFNPNSTFMGTPASVYSLSFDKPETLRVLLKYGAKPETKIPPFWVSVKSQNLMSYAIKRKSSEAVKALIENKVDVNKKFNGNMPLNYALETKQIKIVELLLKAGAMPDEKTMKLAKKSKDEYVKDLFADYLKSNEKEN